MEKQVLVTWHDEPENEFLATVAINENWVDGEDDLNIFFYFDSEEEYQQLLKTGTEEFTMREYV